MDLVIRGLVDDPALLEQELSDALGVSVSLTVIDGDGSPTLDPPPGPVDVAVVRSVIAAHRGGERRQLDQLVTKARQVWNGQGTFTQAQAQKILAGLVLLENRRR